jgi:hypothetical protein
MQWRAVFLLILLAQHEPRPVAALADGCWRMSRHNVDHPWARPEQQISM